MDKANVVIPKGQEIFYDHYPFAPAMQDGGPVVCERGHLRLLGSQYLSSISTKANSPGPGLITSCSTPTWRL
jgi:hypothetical protein